MYIYCILYSTGSELQFVGTQKGIQTITVSIVYRTVNSSCWTHKKIHSETEQRLGTSQDLDIHSETEQRLGTSQDLDIHSETENRLGTSQDLEMTITHRMSWSRML